MSSISAWTEQQITEARKYLQKMLVSPVFVKSERQCRFLKFVVTKMLTGNHDPLKEYTIGIEVFDKPPTFDPATEAIVRVEAGRLRAKLREYYDSEGRTDKVRFDLPKGTYCINITYHQEDHPDAGADTRTATSHLQISDTKPTLAVLPFVNLSNDQEQEYFADGITEDLITDLSKLSGLMIIARQSAFIYKRSSKRAEEIGRELGVRYLLEGSVRRSEKRVRVTTQLIDTHTGRQIWAERYDGELQDIFSVQDNISKSIVASLNIQLLGMESYRLGHEGTSSVEAHDQLLRGLERYWEYSRESTAQALEFFQRATELDPNYATPHAWLARGYVFQWSMMWERGDTLERAYTHVCKALELDPHLPYGHSVLGWIQLWRKQRDEAIEAGLKGVALDPNNADAHMFVSLTLSAAGLGQEGLGCIKTAMRLNPYPSPFYLFALGQCYYVLKRYEEALAVLKRGIELNPLFKPNRVYLAIVYSVLGRDAEAARECEAQRDLVGGEQYLSSIWLDPEQDKIFKYMQQKLGLM